MLGSGWNHRYEADPNSGCWLFNGALDPRGYGRIKVKGQRKTAFAHRAAWLEAYGDPAGLFVLHKCDTPACIRPDHLFLGTQSDNMQDKAKKGRAPTNLGGRKLTDQQVVYVRNSGLSAKSVAAELGISPVTVWQIRSGLIWGPRRRGRRSRPT